MKWSNNDFYEGDYENNLKNGKGVNIFKLIFLVNYIKIIHNILNFFRFTNGRMVILMKEIGKMV